MNKQPSATVGESFADGEARFKLGDQWFYRGNRSFSWFFVASQADGSCQGGIADRAPVVLWPILEGVAKRLSAQSERTPPAEWCKAGEFGCECGRPDTEPCPLPHRAAQRTVAPNVDGQDFYELCHQYRHAKEIMPHGMPNAVQAFNNLREYIKTGRLPWKSFEEAPNVAR